MMKFNTILTEEKKGKTITLTNMDRKLLNLLQKQKVDPKNIDNIILFLNDVLALRDEDLIARLTKLYHFNWKPGMFECDAIRKDECIEDFSEMKKGIISIDEENYSPPIRALSYHLGVDPFFIEEEWEGSINRQDTWLPEYSITYPLIPNIENRRGKTYMMEVRRYKVAKGMDQAYDAAYSRVREDWEENGAEWFSENFIEYYAEVDYDWVDNEAETRAIDDSANVGDEEDMREELGVTSEYNDYKDEIDYTKVEIVKVLTQIEEAEFKRDEIEKEKILLEKEIERLGGDIEYEEDNPNYTEFSDEIERLQIKMNQMEGWFEETKTIIELLYQDHRNLEEDIKEMESEMEKYEGEKLIDDYVVSRTEHWKDVIEDDPLQYLSEWLDMSLAYAIDEGYMVVDEDELIRGAIATDGEAHFLAPYDGDENSEEVDGVDYIMYRTD